MAIWQYNHLTNTNKRGQTTLEFTLCLVVLIILFVAGFLAFKWAGEIMAGRQINFENTRVSATKDFYTTPQLNLHIGFNYSH